MSRAVPRPGLALIVIMAVMAIASLGCTDSGGGLLASRAPDGAGGAGATTEPAEEGEAPFAGVDVCALSTADEVAEVMGFTAHDPAASVMGPGAGIDGAKGCQWSLGDGDGLRCVDLLGAERQPR